MDSIAKAAACYYFMSVTNYYMNLLHYKSYFKKRRLRRLWMLTVHKSRTRITMEQNIYKNLLCEPSNKFSGFVRMSATDFEELLTKVGPLISKKNTRFREAIPTKIRLAVTLRYLASGDSFRSLHFTFKISHQLISKIVKDGCSAIVHTMKDKIQMPASEEEWLRKEASLRDLFCHCLGALDGKHVILLPPNHSGSAVYCNHHSSIPLLTLVDRDLCFMLCEIRSRANICDGDVFKDSVLFERLRKNTLNLPQPQPLDRGSDVPYVFVADDKFLLQQNIMKPYPGKHAEGSVKEKFNRKLCSVRILVENAFGIMSSRFKVLQKPIALHPEQASMVITACVLLHNFLRQSTTSLDIYSPPGYADLIVNGEVTKRGMWRREKRSGKSALRMLENTTKCESQSANEVRDMFAEFFMKTS